MILYDSSIKIFVSLDETTTVQCCFFFPKYVCIYKFTLCEQLQTEAQQKLDLKGKAFSQIRHYSIFIIITGCTCTVQAQQVGNEANYIHNLSTTQHIVQKNCG